MIIYVPDPIDISLQRRKIEIGCLCTPSRCGCVSKATPVLIDIGIAAAVHGVQLQEYLRVIKRVSTVVRADVYAVVPDVFCDATKTIENWHKYAQIIKRLGANPVLVLQSFYTDLDRYMNLIDETEIVALPSRKHCDATCAARPRLCAERIERALRILYQKKVHLLGPALRVLRYLGDTLNQIYSFDTAAYHMAPNAKLKEKTDGRYMPRNMSESAEWLMAWLEQACVI